ncbi:pentatricopeptide repeat-containing protein [Pyrus ussuriensis x Pyrus communis]|uniref:Pentatricopeptide repeat-containing protein n=1 Tax=Pyrus ussuriensis x Pyrus communis TaxID=2448454 RepID=A0A5N5GYZ0_9ROSA|nr:pentatricopeptide repeat-containing protein [Pyrus ussuriensis x Pyrus communis]
MTTVAAKLLPQSLHVTTHPNPSSHQTNAGSCRVCILSNGGNRRRNPLHFVQRKPPQKTAKGGSFRRSKNDPVAEQ